MRFCKCGWILMVILFLCVLNVAAFEKKEFIAGIDPDGIQRVEVLGGSYFFNPNYIIVKVNMPVEMNMRMEPGLIPHNIVLNAPDAGMDISLELNSKPQVIRFTPTRTGNYTFYCDKKPPFLKSHKDKGMFGTLEVRN